MALIDVHDFDRKTYRFEYIRRSFWAKSVAWCSTWLLWIFRVCREPLPAASTAVYGWKTAITPSFVSMGRTRLLRSPRARPPTLLSFR